MSCRRPVARIASKMHFSACYTDLCPKIRVACQNYTDTCP